MAMRFFVFLAVLFNIIIVPLSVAKTEEKKEVKELPEIILGSAEAPHEVVMCFSPTCSHCADYETEYFPKVEEELIKTAKVRFVVRLLPFYALDFSIGKLVWSQGQDKVVGLIKLFLGNQEKWLTPTFEKEATKKELLEKRLSNVAEKLGLKIEDLRQNLDITSEDETAFLKLFCLEHGFTEKQIMDALAENEEMEKSLAAVRLKCLKEDGEPLDFAPAFYWDGKLMKDWATVDVLKEEPEFENEPTQAKKSKSEDPETQPLVRTKRAKKEARKGDLQHQTQPDAAAAA